MTEPDLLSEAFRIGHDVGRGDIERPVPEPADQASFQEGLLVGAAEYGVVFEGGVAVGEYTPKYRSGS